MQATEIVPTLGPCIFEAHSRMQPSELYIPDSLGDTLATRTTTRYGHLHNGHKASVVKIELFMPYFDTDRYVIDHNNGDVYLWDRESNNIKLLSLQVGTTPLSADTVKMLTQTAMRKTLTAICTTSST